MVLALLKEDEYFGYVRRDEDEIKKLAQKLDPNSKERAALEKYEQLAGKVTELGPSLSNSKNSKTNKARISKNKPNMTI